MDSTWPSCAAIKTGVKPRVESRILAVSATPSSSRRIATTSPFPHALHKGDPCSKDGAGRLRCRFFSSFASPLPSSLLFRAALHAFLCPGHAASWQARLQYL